MQPNGPACIAVHQDSMYAIIEGYLSPRFGTLLMLIKTQYPAAVTVNNTWSVVSTTPARYVWDEDNNSASQVLAMVCDVDKDGVFTLRFPDGIGYRYDTLAQKTAKSQTCSAVSNGQGEWKRLDLVSPDEAKSARKLIIQPEAIPSTLHNNSQSEGEMVIYYQYSGKISPPSIHYAQLDNTAYLNKVAAEDLNCTTLSEQDAFIEILEYGNGQIFSVLASAPITGRTTYNRTLVYFPFEAPFHLTSPPTSAVSVPWNVNCDGQINFVLAVVAKGKFYYLCAALDPTSGKDKLVMYIHDSNTRQTQGPFTLLDDATGMLNESIRNRLLPVYSDTRQNEPQFLVVNMFSSYSELSAIDLRELNYRSSQGIWSTFSLPKDIPVGTDLGPNCHNREASKKLAIAGVVSGVFVVVMLVFLCIWRRRKRRSKVKDADQNSSQIAQDEELELDGRSKDVQAPIQDDALP